MSKQIMALVGAGADAFKNMYDVAIRFPWNASPETLTVRATGFEVPDTGVATYDKSYHGVKMLFVKPEQEYERTFELTFRLDAAYNLYGQFITWLSTVGDVVSGGVSNWAPVFGSVVVTSLGGAYSAINYPTLTDDVDRIRDMPVNARWGFEHVIVTKVGQPKFDTASADPLDYTVSFIFGDNRLPFFNQKGLQG